MEGQVYISEYSYSNVNEKVSIKGKKSILNKKG